MGNRACGILVIFKIFCNLYWPQQAERCLPLPASEGTQVTFSAYLAKSIKHTSRTTDTTKSTEQSDKLLDGIAEDFEDDENTTSAVTQKLASIVNKSFSTTLSEGKLKEKLDKYTRHENCAKLAVPKINPEIWMKLGCPARRKVLKMVSVERADVKASLTLTQSAEMLLQPTTRSTCPDLGKLLTINTDALALLGHATREISLRRQQAVRPSLNKEYASLCSPQGPITEFLFGDDRHTQLNNIKSSNKIGNSMTQSQSSVQPRHNDNWRNKTSKPFLLARGDIQDRSPYKRNNGRRKNFEHSHYGF